KPAAPSGSAAAPPATSEPAALAPAEESELKIAKSSPAAPATITPKTTQGMMDDDDDEDDDDDDESLTLPLTDSEKPARKSPEIGRIAEAENRAEPVTDKPAAEKPEVDKPAADKPASEVEKPATPAPMKGFRGYCPVVLKDDRKLIEARPDIKAEYH